MEQNILENNLLISTQMANFGFEKAWNEIGGVLYRTNVGDKFVYDAIKEKNAFLGVNSQVIYFQKLITFLGMEY